MTTAKKPPILSLAAGAVVGLAIGIGLVAWLKMDPSGDQGSGLPDAFDYDLSQYFKIDPALIQYRQTATMPVALADPKTIAVGPDDRILVGGRSSIRVLSAAGEKQQDIAIDGEATALAVGGPAHKLPGRIYVALGDHVEVLDADGVRQAVWPKEHQRSVLTSIGCAEDDVFVADAGAQLVWHYDVDGKLLGKIGQQDDAQNIPMLVIPSPYCDVAIAPDGLLRVVNPGRHLIEAFTFDGDLEQTWGKRGTGVEAFCGCCNPSHIAVLPDGRIVTSEKGIPRIKVYSESGEFECVVAGPDVLVPSHAAAVETRDELRLHPLDVAVDGRSRILALDASAGCVRVFEHK